MRSSLKKKYDDFYYNFEPWFNYVRLRASARAKYLLKKTPPALRAAYKDDILPYWQQFGIRPCLATIRELYDINGITDARFIPDDIWFRYVIPHLNNSRYCRILADKNLNGLLHPTVKRPETLFKCVSGQFCLDDFTPISHDRAIELCRTPGQWVIKPTMDSFQGRDVQFFENPADPQALLDQYANTDFIVQRAVVQHPALASLNPSSINTVRVLTYVFREKAYIDSVILRVGVPGSRVDNIGAGGIQCAVNPDGILSGVAYTKNKAVSQKELVDISRDKRFADFVIPSFQNVCATATTLALKTPHLRLIAWDFAVDEAGDPVLIEFNTQSPGQNQETNGPTFGDNSQKVLSEVFTSRKAHP